MSKSSMPKQFLDILGTGRTFIQMTFDRFKPVCPIKNFVVVTNVDYKELVMQQLPELDESQILLEPLRRNTAACIAYACNRVRVNNPNATIVVTPSDHLILDEPGFRSQIESGLRFVKNNDVLLTLGIPPNRPETGFGYIQIEEQVEGNLDSPLYKVKTFTEKPDLEMARIFVASGEFYWNSGIFIWTVDSICKAFARHLPEMHDLFRKGEKMYGTPDEVFFINKTYSECLNTSIDYGIMEKAENVYVLCGDFGWSDVGTWGALYAHHPKTDEGNVVEGENVFLYNSQNCVVNIPDNKVAVLQGLDGYIVVESDDIIMVCRKDDEQNIRHFVNDVRLKKGTKFV